jgi:ketosteroid isomerase-like protein
MTRENVEIVRRLNAAFIGGDPQPLSAFLAPDAVWDMSTFSGWPDQSEYRGPEEYARFIEAWSSPYDEWSYEVEELLPVGENQVVAKLYQRGKPRGSAGWIDLRYGILYTIEGGVVQRAAVYATVDQALEAARGS